MKKEVLRRIVKEEVSKRVHEQRVLNQKKAAAKDLVRICEEIRAEKEDLKILSQDKKRKKELLEMHKKEEEEREVLNHAAKEIQRIVRGWNVRKAPTLLKIREWGRYTDSSVVSSDFGSTN